MVDKKEVLNSVPRKMKQIKWIWLTAFLLLLIISGCYKKGYFCRQYLQSGQGYPIEVTEIEFKNEKEFEKFEKPDTVIVNDSTKLYWECIIAE